MKALELTIEVRGTRPLLMHSSILADPLSEPARALARLTAKRPKTDADHREIARIEWAGGMWLHDEKPCIPPEAAEAAFIGAARMRRRGKAASAGLQVVAPAILQHDGPADLAAMWKDTRFNLRVPVRVGSARTIRTRACFPVWRAVFTISFLPSMLNESEVRETFALAGVACGVGDWRPKYGLFELI